MSEEWFSSWFASGYYPILYKSRDFSEASAFIKSLIREISPTAGTRILDIACGEGRHAYFLNRLGYDVVGIDLSANSIQKAKQLANERLSFYVHDMRDSFHFGKFGLCLNLFTSFGYFNHRNENLKVLQNVRESLAPGGIFVLDFMNTPRILEQLVPSEQKEIDGIRFDIRRMQRNGTIVKEIHIEDKGKHFDFSEKVQAFSREDLESIIGEAGMEVYKVWGNYSGESWIANESGRLILFCRPAHP